MISTDCRIETFFDTIEGKTFTEAAILANQEATEAERVILQHKSDSGNCHCDVEYVEKLKEFIVFMRCAVPKTDYRLENITGYFSHISIASPDFSGCGSRRKKMRGPH
ncbi:MAG: hypothetical protein WAL90_17360 [Desulfobacterales bacterium]